MRMSFFRFFCVLFMLVWEWGGIVNARTGRALIVAIGEYPIDGGWENIHGDNDGVLMAELLNRQYYTQIILLKNEKATKESIVNSLQQLCDNTVPGDYLFLHFSCHGQQMMDLSGDEEDGLDEALIPYDAMFWYLPGVYEGEKHLCDDELGSWIDKLRRKAGRAGQVFILLDACHSGTANRYTPNLFIRGVNMIFAPDGYCPKSGTNLKRSMNLKSLDNLAPALVLSACKPEETNYEYYSRKARCHYGKLTYSFVQVATQKSSTFVAADWCKAIEKTMRQLPSGSLTRLQHPYMECSDEKKVFVLSVAR